MAKKIALFNSKGGVGKSTTAINLCAALARRNNRCLLVDLDWQANSTLALGFEEEMGNTIYESMMDVDMETPLQVYNYENNFDYVASSPRLDDIETKTIGRFGIEQLLLMLILGVEANYDFIIFDCPPKPGLMGRSALVACDDVLIPHDCGQFSEAGIPKVVSLCRQAKTVNKKLNIMGFLLTKFCNTTTCKNAEARLHEVYPELKVFDTKISSCAALGKGLDDNQTIFTYKGSGTAQGRVDYRSLAGEVIEYYETK